MERINFSEEMFSGLVGGSFYWDHSDSQNRFWSVGDRILSIALTPEGIKVECERIVTMVDYETPCYDEIVFTLSYDKITGVYPNEGGDLRVSEDFGDLFFHNDNDTTLIDRWIDIMIHGPQPW